MYGNAHLTTLQVARHTAEPTLVLAVDQSSWMMFGVPQVPASYYSVLAEESCHTTVATLKMLVWNVKV